MSTPTIPLSDQVVAMLRYAVGSPGPICIEVRSPDGSTASHEVTTPFAIIGRGTNCDIRLSDPRISFRHLYLQPIGPRLACVDLFTALGIKWTAGPPFSGWLSPEHQFAIADYQLQVVGDYWASGENVKPPLEFRPRDEQAPEYGVLPTVELELLNTPLKGKRWPINRIMTLMGRDERCRISVSDDRVSRIHCSLLLLPSGLWVVDLMGKGGIQVNGVDCRCSMLAEGVELTVGPYQLAAHYPEQHAAKSLSVPSPGTAQEFVTRHNRFFTVEGWQDTLVIRPLGKGSAYFYQHVHAESSRVNDVINTRKYRHLIVDFSGTESLGQVILEAMAQMCRSIPGNAAFCNATPEIYAELDRVGLTKIWHHYLSREDAFLAVHAEDTPS